MKRVHFIVSIIAIAFAIGFVGCMLMILVSVPAVARGQTMAVHASGFVAITPGLPSIEHSLAAVVVITTLGSFDIRSVYDNGASTNANYQEMSDNAKGYVAICYPLHVRAAA